MCGFRPRGEHWVGCGEQGPGLLGGILHSGDDAGLEGHGLTFTLGRGNELCVAALKYLAKQAVGRSWIRLRRISARSRGC
jgi:hypothetical protein